MAMVFKVDTIEEFAVMEGNAGMSPLDYHIGDTAFSLMEKVRSGTVQTTTITRDGDAVHSRNTVISGKVMPSQYVGKCSTSIK